MFLSTTRSRISDIILLGSSSALFRNQINKVTTMMQIMAWIIIFFASNDFPLLRRVFLEVLVYKEICGTRLA